MDDREFAVHLRSALLHLDDLGQLEANPLARQIAPAAGADVSPGARLRQVLADLIEEMKPGEDVSEESTARRRYHILHDRYVLQQPMWRIEQKLSLGDRQVRREHSRALANLAARLRTRTRTRTRAAPPLPAAVQQAVQRLAPRPHVFSLGELMAEVVALAAALGPNAVDWEARPADATVFADRGILHQMLLKLLVRLGGTTPPGARLRLLARRDADRVWIGLRGPFEIEPAGDEALQLCCWLAQSMQAELTWNGPPVDFITFDLPAGTQLRRVLIVDDELPAIELYESYLAGRDYQVTSASNPDLAVPAAVAAQPDVIVLDVMMPSIDGWELLQRLRHAPGVENVPVIVCSVIRDAELALALGAARFLQKPILRQQLIEAIEGVLIRP